MIGAVPEPLRLFKIVAGIAMLRTVDFDQLSTLLTFSTNRYLIDLRIGVEDGTS